MPTGTGKTGVIAVLTRLSNPGSSLVLTGGILRRRKDDGAAPALLLAPAAFSVEEEWDAYLEFETKLELLEPKHFRQVVDALLTSQPNVEYFDGKFRRRFNPCDLQQKPQVVIAPSVLVRTALADFSLDKYIQDCTDTLNTEDAVILGADMNAPCQRSSEFALWVYASVRNSRFLQNTSLYEIKLETHCVVLTGGYVLISDSRGILPDEYLDDHTSGVAQDKLARFLDATFRATHVSVDSSIPYETVLRGADLRGHDLLKVPPSLTDRIQICRAARGASSKSGRRYIGMHSGRLRKEATVEERRTFEPGAFVDWARGVATILDSDTTASAVFKRFMPTCDPPTSPTPRTICIDLLRLNLDLKLSDGPECALKSSSVNVGATAMNNKNNYTCSFQVEAKNTKPETLTLKITYDDAKKRFWFNKDTGPSVQVNLQGEEESTSKGLAEFLNQNQDVVLIGLEGGEIVYQGRRFYQVDYRYAEQALVDLIRRPTNAGRYATEKGTKAQVRAAKDSKAISFPDHSIFRGVADRRIRFPFTDDLMICADMGTECADFVAASFAKRELSLIHAKAGTGTGISAAAFHDVVAQAMKNLVYLTRNAETPKGAGSWRRDGKWNSTGVQRLYRTSPDLPSAAALWAKLRSDILGDSNPRLYVTLVTTGCCDVEELMRAVHDPAQRTPEIAQLLHLLDGLNGFARQLGVQLLIYDLPYVAP